MPRFLDRRDEAEPAAAELLGRPVTMRGDLRDGALSFDWPLAIPPAGDYDCLVDGEAARLRLSSGGTAHLDGPALGHGPVEISLRA